MEKSFTYEQLIEKIVRAKIALGRVRYAPHKGSCPVEWDPEGYAPCNCGAGSVGEAVSDALAALELK